MRSFAATDTGRVRKINEDSYYNDPEHMGLYIVADGMGGHQAGEVASSLAVETLSTLLRDSLKGGNFRPSYIEDVMRVAVVKTNRKIYDLATSESGYSGMGTTVVVCIIKKEHLHVAHIGDSRAYLLRDDVLKQLTTDHSLVQELLSKGRITEEEAVDHPRKNILTRALGTDPAVEVDTMDIALKSGDIILLCTDGITNHVDPQEIKGFASMNSPEMACREMIRLANDRGGFDNMTVLIIENIPAQEDRP